MLEVSSLRKMKWGKIYLLLHFLKAFVDGCYLCLTSLKNSIGEDFVLNVFFVGTFLFLP